MDRNWILTEAIERTGVLKAGHFLLSSGQHSAEYMQCAQLLQHPVDAGQTGNAVAQLFKEKIDVVVGPALGGVIIAHEVARALGIRCLFTERKEGRMILGRGFIIEPGERALIVEDVVTTGGSVQEVIALLERMKAEIVGVGSIIDRSSGVSPFSYPYQSLAKIQIQSYPPQECPLCEKGIPVMKPGSRTPIKEK